MDSLKFLPKTDESSTHLPLLQRKENLKKKDQSNKTKIRINEFHKVTAEKEKRMNMESSEKHSNFQSLIDIKNKVHKRKTTDKNKSLVNVIENGLVDLANEIKEMSENEIENEKLYEIVHIFERVLYFNDKKPIRART